MSKRLWFLLGGGGIGVALVATFFAGRAESSSTSSTSSTRPAPDGQQDIAKLRQEVQSLRAVTSILLRAGGQPSTAAPVSSARASTLAEAPDHDESAPPPQRMTPAELETTRQRIRADLKHRIDELEQKMRGEPVDRAWVSDVRSSLDTAFGDELKGSALKSFECRSTLCRIDVVHDDALAESKFRTKVPTLIPGIGGGTVLQDQQPDGHLVSICMYERETKPGAVTQ